MIRWVLTYAGTRRKRAAGTRIGGSDSGWSLRDYSTPMRFAQNDVRGGFCKARRFPPPSFVQIVKINEYLTGIRQT